MTTSYTLSGAVELDHWPHVFLVGTLSTPFSPGLVITRLSSTLLQIDFSAAVLIGPKPNRSTLTWPGAYKVTPIAPNADDLPELEIFQVRLGTITTGVDYDSVTRVYLETSEQGPTTYDVVIFGLEPAG